MDWNSAMRGFELYLKLERGLSFHSISAYRDDINKLCLYASKTLMISNPSLLMQGDIERFNAHIFDAGFSDRSQARILSGVKTFYKYLMMEDLIDDSPAYAINGPKLSKKIPDILSIDEIQTILDVIDLSADFGHRDRAIIETLYACGIRVSECTDLRCSQLFVEQQIIRVIGKGNKERIVPIGDIALHYIAIYRDNNRNKLPVVKGHEDFLFLNRFGKKLSRISIFNMVKKYCMMAGISKEISPHTFRHSFATHLMNGGVNLRAIQEMLGHESITTTEIYAHVDSKLLRDTILSHHPRNQQSNLK